ncbi:hypothetical protein J0910_14915 [Nocardiopsis sp. CNT-189]|uniref:hypothetical protein n=1 Tax=Nocardiopsis oceanisediminis TaxID=2816862 RepID=UPI003B29B611
MDRKPARPWFSAPSAVICWTVALFLLIGPVPWNGEEYGSGPSCEVGMGRALDVSQRFYDDPDYCSQAATHQMRTALLWILASLPFTVAWARHRGG